MDYDVKMSTQNECNEVAEPEFDIVQHPHHYNREGAIECIDEIELIFGPEVTMHFCLGNVLKYRYRAGLKNDDYEDIEKFMRKHYEDIEKSDWYMRKYKELKEKVNRQKESLTVPNTPYVINC